MLAAARDATRSALHTPTIARVCIMVIGGVSNRDHAEQRHRNCVIRRDFGGVVPDDVHRVQERTNRREEGNSCAAVKAEVVVCYSTRASSLTGVPSFCLLTQKG
jgi:hypothetical protein